MDEVDEGVVDGYLLLADISEYTEFLTGTELEHSHAIVTELTKLIRRTLAPLMWFVKLGGRRGAVDHRWATSDPVRHQPDHRPQVTLDPLDSFRYSRHVPRHE
jgi:hypothetical protein